MKPARTYVEIWRKKPDNLNEVNLWHDAIADVEHLVRAICSTNTATFLPVDRIEGFAFDGEFGPVDLEVAFSSIREQLAHPRYVDGRAVFPVIKLGQWTLEVI